MKYIKKPIPIEISEPWFVERARLFPEVKGYPEEAINPRVSNCQKCGESLYRHGWVSTLEGGHIVCPGDRIITGVKGEKYPIKPDIFEETYEPA